MDKSSLPIRDNTPRVVTPVEGGNAVYETEAAYIDYSNIDQGYFFAGYFGECENAKLQIMTPDNSTTYTYNLFEKNIFSLTAGDGEYQVVIYEKIQDDIYSMALSQTLNVKLVDEFKPFLIPNEYVVFDNGSSVVSLGVELSKDAHDNQDVIDSVYEYIKSNIVYDTDHADNIMSGETGYIPDLDTVIKDKKGICFDYAALMTAMLRSQNIPTKLEVGLTGKGVPHAWVSVYNDKQWVLMDPTLAASADEKKLQKYIGNGSNYILRYEY